MGSFVQEWRINIYRGALIVRTPGTNRVKEVEAGENSSTKLPKLVIAPFNGWYYDWSRFWGQFSTGIDLADIPEVMKFSYLKELVEPKIQTCIDWLPIRTEGYKNAKKILEDKYGNTSEIVNWVHVEKIVNLPTVTCTRSEKIHSCECV
jgi:hypothetical protein